MKTDLLYQIALTLIPNIGAVQAKLLLQQFEAPEIFKAKKSLLEKIEGIGEIRASSIREFDNFSAAEEEIAFIEKYKVRPLFISDRSYPQRLLNCYDSPTMLYYKGEADLNTSKVVSIIGTRSNTEYGRRITETLVNDLVTENILVVSGLAFGIDAIAHKTALKNSMATVGVTAHGLDQIYPLQHASLARDMAKNGGGILTEFRSKTKPDKHNFPIRNRVVAGMSDATIVVETGIKGGSMITAELADGYNKDVFAFPGKVTDSQSAGCNHLIKSNKAFLLTGADDLIKMMGWEERKVTPKQQRALFAELSADEKIIVELLKEKDSVHIDELNLRSGLNSSTVASVILNLELQNVIVSSPGKMYKLS